MDRELAEEGAERYQRMLQRFLQMATERAEAVSSVLETARSHAGYLSAVSAEEAEVLLRHCGIGAQAGGALFALASGTGEVELALGSNHVKLAATGPTGATHPGLWRIGWWLAHIVNDQAAIGLLTATPIAVLRGSSSRADECQYLFVDALQAFHHRAANWGDKLQAALDATDPENRKFVDEDFVLNILVTEMQMLFYLGLGESKPFGTALELALERHKKYWSKASRRESQRFLALGPLALARMALSAGLPIDVQSDYLPRSLLQRAAGNG